MQVPTIDLRPFISAGDRDPARREVADAIGAACTDRGFFGVVGHGIDADARSRLEDAARSFFALDPAEKAEIAMARGGAAWRGWFPVGGELTSGIPDAKEGIYFGTDLASTDPAVRAATPLHGPNLYPRRPGDLKPLVDSWMTQVTATGRWVLRAIAMGIGLPESFFDPWCVDPVVLFRIFHYPAPETCENSSWGVAEHTDYGLLTLLAQDATGGLQVHGRDGWVDVPPDPAALVCNLGDMLERVTGGLCRSTPHRVARPTASRISMPLFLDPSWDAVVEPIAELSERVQDRPPDRRRWDDASVFDGPTRYGDYLSAKVAQVFPDLFDAVLRDPTGATAPTEDPQR